MCSRSRDASDLDPCLRRATSLPVTVSSAQLPRRPGAGRDPSFTRFRSTRAGPAHFDFAALSTSTSATCSAARNTAGRSFDRMAAFTIDGDVT